MSSTARIDFVRPDHPSRGGRRDRLTTGDSAGINWFQCGSARPRFYKTSTEWIDSSDMRRQRYEAAAAATAATAAATMPASAYPLRTINWRRCNKADFPIKFLKAVAK